MSDSVHKFIPQVGTSTASWERAATTTVETATNSLEDLRIAEIEQLDLQIHDGKVVSYRAKVRVSFKYNGEE